MFLGEFFYICDDKNRLRIPPKFRKEFNAGLVLTKGNDGCLFIMSKKQFEEMYEKIKALPIFDAKAQRPLRMLFSSAKEIFEDNQGRFLLPSNLKEFAKIKKEVVFVGVGSRVELWAENNWKTYCQKSKSNVDQILSKLGEYGV